MELLYHSLLTIVTFFPLVGALIVFFYGRSDGSNADQVKRLAIGFSAVEFVLSLPLALYFRADAGMQFEQARPWISAAGLNVIYHVGIDGLSLWLVILTTLITPVAMLASYGSITKRVREFMALMLVLETGMVGV